MATDQALDKTFNRFSFICGQNVFGSFLCHYIFTPFEGFDYLFDKATVEICSLKHTITINHPHCYHNCHRHCHLRCHRHCHHFFFQPGTCVTPKRSWSCSQKSWKTLCNRGSSPCLNTPRLMSSSLPYDFRQTQRQCLNTPRLASSSLFLFLSTPKTCNVHYIESCLTRGWWPTSSDTNTNTNKTQMQIQFTNEW